MSEERFEVFGNIIKDNEDIPALLNNYQATVRLNELNDKVKELEQELAELKEKDNYRLRYELAGADETITNLKKQLAEKDKEIEKLKQQYTILENENGKLTTELIVDKYKKAQKEVSFGKQLAIQELEKVKILLQNAVNYEKYTFVGIYDAVNNQIKELRGE